MAICIVGGGLSGLATVVKIKLKNPDIPICLVDNPNSNSQISGQRFRQRVIGKKGDPSENLLQILTERNNGVTTQGMEHFSQLIGEELSFWENLSVTVADSPGHLPFATDPNWFGPKWGGNENHAGIIVLEWFRKLASGLGVDYIRGDITKIDFEGSEILKIYGQNRDKGGFRLSADEYVFAGGNPGGQLFHSTNKRIRHTPIELLWNSHVMINDLTSHMLHPFGRATADGRQVLGCFETDNLAGAKVFLYNTETAQFDIEDEVTSEYLAEHQAHYKFPEISARFINYGEGRTKIVLPSGEVLHSSVAHHYSQMGIETNDYTHVKGLDNAFVVGDAAGVGRYTGNKVRLPGMGLSACLIDAEFASMQLANSSKKTYALEYTSDLDPEQHLSNSVLETLRTINTTHLLQVLLRNGNPTNWAQDLEGLNGNNSFLELLSSEIAIAFYESKTDAELTSSIPKS